ncbi:MAG: D-aminoacyl-tRNA deacylase [Bacteroidota bacterium]
MRIVIQRVLEASVNIDGKQHSRIDKGLMILLGIHTEDTETQADYLCKKIADLRIFSDAEGKMNLSCADINGNIMVVSQFTLYADTAKGNRPSYITTARPETAIPLYEYFITKLKTITGKEIATGVFGADMQIQLINDGPVTITMEK